MADALNSQKCVTDAILKNGADYLLPIKMNSNKELTLHVEAIFNRNHQRSIKNHKVEKNHGRIDEWYYEVLPAKGNLDPRIKNQHSKVRTLVKYAKISERIIDGKCVSRSNNTRYYISSLPYDENTIYQISFLCGRGREPAERIHSVQETSRVFLTSPYFCDLEARRTSLLATVAFSRWGRAQGRRGPREAGFSLTSERLRAKVLLGPGGTRGRSTTHSFDASSPFPRALGFRPFFLLDLFGDEVRQVSQLSLDSPPSQCELPLWLQTRAQPLSGSLCKLGPGEGRGVPQARGTERGPRPRPQEAPSRCLRWGSRRLSSTGLSPAPPIPWLFAKD